MQHCGQAFSRDFAFMTSASAPSSSSDSDLQLVERTVAGDQRAYELLVIKYQRRIERLIARMVRDPDLVQDIAQETFSRRGAVLHLAVPDCRQHGQEGPGGHAARPGGAGECVTHFRRRG